MKHIVGFSVVKADNYRDYSLTHQGHPSTALTVNTNSSSLSDSRYPVLPGRIKLLLRLRSQGAVFAQQETGRHRSCAQAGQQHSRVAARDQTCERARHLSARWMSLCQKQMSWKQK